MSLMQVIGVNRSMGSAAGRMQPLWLLHGVAAYTSRSLTALTWASDAPLVTVVDPVTPGVMAR
jgi:hypothetical protein